MTQPHITISAEPLAFLGQFAISNSIFTSLIASGIIIILALITHSKLKTTSKPRGLQNLMEMLVEALYKLTQDITQSSQKAKLIFPITTSFFLFILVNNWLGLLPGFGTIGLNHEPEASSHSLTLTTPTYANESLISETGTQSDTQTTDNPSTFETAPSELHDSEGSESSTHKVFIPIFRAGSADLNTTIALALFSMTYVQFLGFKFLGLSYLTKFFNFKNAIMTFVGILELISEFAKIISFSFRLFGNIFAGEVLLVVIGSLIPVFATIPFLFLELFVGVIQALVFAMLSIVFMSMATQSHSEH